MEKDTETIKNEIETFKTDNGGEYEDYYIGITKHIDQRLIESNNQIIEHLQKGEYTKGNPTYTAECINNVEAVIIERWFQKEKKMLKFNPRSFGLTDSKFIYCYKMTEENRNMVLLETSTNVKETKNLIKKFKDFK